MKFEISTIKKKTRYSIEHFVKKKVIDDIIDQMYPQDLKEGQILVHAGEACNAFFIVQFGGLEVLASTKTNPFI